MSTGYTIYSYGNVDTLSTLFNGIAALMGADGYSGAIALVLIMGFLGALVSMAFLKHQYGVQWLIAVFLINGVLLVPKSTIQIVDKLAGQSPVVIDNVPWGVASLASLVTSMGSELTELFETAFQSIPAVLGSDTTATLPATLSYEKTGMMFGATLIKQSLGTSFSDPTFNTDVVGFIENCTLYDLSQGFIDPKTFVDSTDIWPLIANTNPARFTTLHAINGTVDSYSCTNAYSRLDNQMPNQVANQIANLAGRVSPALKASIKQNVTVSQINQAVSDTSNAMEAAYARALIGGAVASTAQLVRQNGLINATRGAGALFSQRTNDPSSIQLGLAQSQTTAAMNAQQIVSGAIAEEALPMLHNGIEALVYAAFPLVVLMALIMGGIGAVRVLKMYALSMVWLALWPPLYAVVNYLHGTAAAKSIAMAGYVDGIQGVSIATAPTIYSTALSELSITSWLLVSVPVIASAIVFGMDKLANVGIGFMSAAGSSASFGSRSAGDMSGNVNMDQIQLAPNRTDAFMSQYNNALGTSTHDIATGANRFRANLGQSAASLGSSTEIGNRLSTASANMERVATQESEAAQQAQTATFSNLLNYTHRHGVGSVFGDDWQHGHDAGVATKIDRADSITEQIKSDLGIKDTEQAQRVLAASIQGQAAVGLPKAAAILSPLTASINASLGASGRHVSNEDVYTAMTKAREAAHKAGITDTRSLTDSFVHSQGFQDRINAGDEQARQIQSGYQETLTHTQSAQKSHDQAQEYRHSAERVMAMAARGEINWTPEFNNYVRKYALNEPGEHGIRDMGDLTGDKAVYWMNKFFSEGEMGRAMDGSPVLMERYGFQSTPNPMRPESNANLGDRYANLTPPTVGGQAVTPQSVVAQGQLNRDQVPGVAGYSDPKAKGVGVKIEVRAHDLANQVEANRMRKEAHQGRDSQEHAIKDRTNHMTNANKMLGNDKTTGVVSDAASPNHGADGKW
jgi:conjugal transfer mating pair stabilization protein TraG